MWNFWLSRVGDFEIEKKSEENSCESFTGYQMRNSKLRNDESELETAARTYSRHDDNSDFYYSVAALIVLVVLTIIGFFIIGNSFILPSSFIY